RKARRQSDRQDHVRQIDRGVPARDRRAPDRLRGRDRHRRRGRARVGEAARAHGVDLPEPRRRRRAEVTPQARPPRDITPERFFTEWLPPEFEREFGPGKRAASDITVSVALEGEGGGHWILDVRGGKLSVR